MMMKTTLTTVSLLLALALLGGCSTADTTPDASIAPMDTMDASDDAPEPLDTIGDTPFPDIGTDAFEPSDTPQVDTTPADVPPVPGDPCDDGDPCTAAELILVDGTCGGGQPYTCDDGRDCTTDTCDGLGDCVFVVSDGFCLANGVCADDGAASPQDPCLLCDADQDPVAWTPAEDGEACDDGDLCTLEGTCQGGACVADPDPCDDGNPCTDGSCHPTDGCGYVALTGTECPPPDACTEWAMCQDGVCVAGDGIDCDDGNICTGDSCLPDGGCAHTTLDGVPCDDGSVCTLDDVCVGDVCGGGAVAPCDDGNECTADLCHPVSGCYHELGDNPCCDDQGVNICDDGDHCTTDSCDPDTGECFYEFNALPCDDQDSCTGPDLCTDGACLGAPMDCEDDNPCTVDACEVGVGCVHAPAEAGLACDDGLDCSTGDHCEEAACVADLSECGCVVDFSDAVNKVNGLLIGTDGQAGSGLDVDNNPTTCSPAGSCGGGIDNALSMLGGFANEALQGSVEDGQVIFLFEHRNFSATGEVYEVIFHIGEAADEQCDVQGATCPYLVDPATFDETCAPLVSLDNAAINGATLSAGGPGYSFPLVLPISDGVLLEVTLFATQVQAQVAFEAGMPVSLDGILAGAISKAAMIEALDAVPADQLPLDKDLIIQMIQGLIQSDIDSDGDGAMDAASVGLPFTAISGTIVGLAQE
jgi:hypothetical protein